MVRVVRFHELGAPEDVIRIDDVNVPEPVGNEVQITVEAFALNRVDDLFTNGWHYSIPDLPSGIGSEAAGTVKAIGPDVTRFGVGNRVCTVPFDNSKYGVQSEVALCPEDYVVTWPDALSAEDAASCWMQYLTAYFALIDVGEVVPDDCVLIAAASSSAGIGAIQLCKDAGAMVIATTRTGKKADAICAVGADHVIATDHGPLAKRILQLTNGRGVRLIYDPVGGSFLQTYVDALAWQARIILYGLLSGDATEVPVVEMVRRAAILHPYSMFNHVSDPVALAKALQYISQRLADGSLRPVVDRVFDFDNTIDAYRYLSGKSLFGKIVVRSAS